MKYNFIFLLCLVFCSFLVSEETNRQNITNLSTTNVDVLKDRYKIIDTEPKEIINLLVQKFTNYNSLTLEFREVVGKLYRRGKISFKKPNFLHVTYWDSKNQPTMEFYANESKVFIYMKAINTVIEQDLIEENLKETKDAYDPKLINLNKLLRTYNFNFMEAKVPVNVLIPSEFKKFHLYTTKKNVLAYHFSLTQKDKTMGKDEMQLWIGTNGLITRSQTKLSSGRVLDYLFYNYNLNVDFKKYEFVFDIPANAQVVKNTLFGIELNDSKEGKEKTE